MKHLSLFAVFFLVSLCVFCAEDNASKELYDAERASIIKKIVGGDYDGRLDLALLNYKQNKSLRDFQVLLLEQDARAVSQFEKVLKGLENAAALGDSKSIESLCDFYSFTKPDKEKFSKYFEMLLTADAFAAVKMRHYPFYALDSKTADEILRKEIAAGNISAFLQYKERHEFASGKDLGQESNQAEALRAFLKEHPSQEPNLKVAGEFFKFYFQNGDTASLADAVRVLRLIADSDREQSQKKSAAAALCVLAENKLLPDVDAKPYFAIISANGEKEKNMLMLLSFNYELRSAPFADNEYFEKLAEKSIELGNYDFADSLANYYLNGSQYITFTSVRPTQQSNLTDKNEISKLYKLSFESGNFDEALQIYYFYMQISDFKNAAKWLLISSKCDRDIFKTYAILYVNYMGGRNGFEKNEMAAAQYLKLGVGFSKAQIYMDIIDTYLGMRFLNHVSAAEKSAICDMSFFLFTQPVAGNTCKAYQMDNFKSSKIWSLSRYFDKTGRESLIKAASKYPEYSYNIALLLLKDGDYANAFSRFENAGVNGDARGFLALAACNALGVGCAQDKAKFKEYAEKAVAVLKTSTDKRNLHNAFWGVRSDLNRCDDKFRKNYIEYSRIINDIIFISALEGVEGAAEFYLESIVDMGPMADVSSGNALIEKFGKNAFTPSILLKFYLLKKYDAADAPAVLELAEIYFKSEKGTNDILVFTYPFIYLNGVGVNADAQRAFKLVQELASEDAACVPDRNFSYTVIGDSINKDGKAAANYVLSYMYQNGFGVEKDENKAAELRDAALKKYEHIIGIQRIPFRMLFSGGYYAPGTFGAQIFPLVKDEEMRLTQARIVQGADK